VVTSREQRRGIDHIVYAIEIAASENKAESFSAPVEILPNDFKNWAGNAVVLSDGAIVVSFAEFESAVGATPLFHPRIWAAKSWDGGRTFPMPILVTEQTHMESFPMMAVDTSSSTHKDRVYLVSSFPGTLRVWFSDEKGEKWHESAIPNSDEVGDSWKLRNPQVAVNDTGVVAVAWRAHPKVDDSSCSRMELSVSRDGGQTFTSPVPICPTSCASVPENQLPQGFLERWIAGGEYFGLAAGRNGVFHLLWPDSRDGHWSLWTTTANVGGSQLDVR